MLTSALVYSQTLYSVDYVSQADVKVFVVNYLSQADLKVFKVDNAVRKHLKFEIRFYK